MSAQCDCGNRIDIHPNSSLCHRCLRREARRAVNPERLRATLANASL